MAAKEFIVAIELGSSKMTGIAGQKNLDGSIQVLAVVKENSSAFIRKGVVYNIDKKLDRLQKFYIYGLNQVGWNKYNYISVEFNNQIICKKNKRKK